MSRSLAIRGWRKVSVSTWGQPPDPQIFGDLEVDATAMLAFIEDARAHGVHLTLTHLVGKAMAHAFAEHPDLNGHLRLGRFVQNRTVDIFFIVSTGGGVDLSGVKVVSADGKPVATIATELAERTERIHTGGDPEFGRSKGTMDRLPRFLLKPVLRLLAWLAGDLELDLGFLGLPRRPFGSAMVSSVGMFGITHAYAPLSPLYRVPLLILVGEVRRRPVVLGNAIVARPILPLAASLDHRYLDGFHAARLARAITAYCADPAAFEPPWAGKRPRPPAPKGDRPAPLEAPRAQA